MMIRGQLLKPLDLIASAQTLLEGSNRPKEASLRRAQSAIYYALFHCLARNCADSVIGQLSLSTSRRAWQQTYRALEHRAAKTACRDNAILSRFPDDVRDFANAFATLQERRHSADYDPFFRVSKSEVEADIELAADVIVRFQNARALDRRAFAAHVLFKKRPT